MLNAVNERARHSKTHIGRAIKSLNPLPRFDEVINTAQTTNSCKQPTDHASGTAYASAPACKSRPTQQAWSPPRELAKAPAITVMP